MRELPPIPRPRGSLPPIPRPPLMQELMPLLPPPPPSLRLLAPNLLSRHGGVTLQANDACGFLLIKRGRSIPRAANVDPHSRCYQAGLRQGFVLTFVGNRDARSCPAIDLQTMLETVRPLRIRWEDDRHTQQFDEEAVAQAQQRARRIRNDTEREVRRRRIHENPEDIPAFLVLQHPHRATLQRSQMRLKFSPPCEHCNFAPLQIEKLLGQARCCHKGAFFDHSMLPQLEPLSDTLKTLFVNNVAVLSCASLQLNQALNLAVMGISPSRAEGGGGLLQRVPAARVQTIRCQGRLYRYIMPGDRLTAPAK